MVLPFRLHHPVNCSDPHSRNQAKDLASAKTAADSGPSFLLLSTQHDNRVFLKDCRLPPHSFQSSKKNKVYVVNFAVQVSRFQCFLQTKKKIKKEISAKIAMSHRAVSLTRCRLLFCISNDIKFAWCFSSIRWISICGRLARLVVSCRSRRSRPAVVILASFN